MQILKKEKKIRKDLLSDVFLRTLTATIYPLGFKALYVTVVAPWPINLISEYPNDCKSCSKCCGVLSEE